MGWTHYWECETELPVDRFATAAEDCRFVFQHTDIKIGGPKGMGVPVLTSESIVFNGSGGLSCEDFSFSRINVPRRDRNKFLGFCKTEHLPYDICVQAALIILKHHCRGLVTVSSDAKNGDWKEAIDFCQKYLGYGSDFVLEKIQ